MMREAAARRWLRLLPERIPGVSFARIKLVTRDAQAAAVWHRPSPALDGGTTVSDGTFLRRSSASKKRLKINALRFVQNLEFCTIDNIVNFLILPDFGLARLSDFLSFQKLRRQQCGGLYW